MKNASDTNRLRVESQGPEAGSGAADTRAPRCQAGVVDLAAVRTARLALPAAEDVDRAVELFALLSNPTRFRMLLALAGDADAATPARELCVHDIAASVGASESMTSHQLRLLRQAGVVTQRRRGREMLYGLRPGPLPHLLADAVAHVLARRGAP